MSLSAAKVRNTAIKNNRYKLHDSKGLFLVVRPSGTKNWHFSYKIFGREKTISLGSYPDVSLKEARESREKASEKISKGVDPSLEKKLLSAQGELGQNSKLVVVTEDWLKRKGNMWTKKYQRDVWRRLNNHIFKYLGDKPIQLITPQELLMVVRKIEEQGKLDMASRCLQVLGQIFRYSVALGLVERDITQDLKGTLTTRKVKHNPILREEDISEFLKKLKIYDGHILTKLAVESLLLTMVRTKELRGMQWAEINFAKSEWRIPALRMKSARDHIVHLSRRMIEIIQTIRQMELSEIYVFPNQQHHFEVMSTNTILYALYRMGYHGRLTAHGFRGTASTILNENGFNTDWIERQLAHVERNSVRAAYNHAQYLPERRKMMDWWSEYLENKKVQYKEPNFLLENNTAKLSFRTCHKNPTGISPKRCN